MPDYAKLAQRFANADEFVRSPLYQVLCQAVAEDERMLRLASRSRSGQQPTFLFLAAIHYLLLEGADHELARFYPSIVGADALPPAGAGPALASFCAAFEPELIDLLETRLVQTNAVRRSFVLRVGFAALAREEHLPVHVIEIGASAGIHLRFDRYGYRLGDRQFGDPASPVQIAADWPTASATPDLDALPTLGSTIGIDLNPLDASNREDRKWLEALVWPDNQDERHLLDAALDVVATDPPTVVPGDAIDILPQLATDLPAGEPRLTFEVATRMHMPQERRAQLDTAVAALAQSAPLWETSSTAATTSCRWGRR